MRVNYYCLQKLKISTRVSNGVLSVADSGDIYVCGIRTWSFMLQNSYSVKVNILYLTFVYLF